MMQPRFERRTGNGPYTLVDQPRFRAGLDFLRLRCDSGEVDESLWRWWEEFSLAGDEDRRELLAQARQQDQGRRQAGAAVGAPGEAPEKKKRRRRRRKPAAAGAEAAPAAGGGAAD